MDYNDIHDWIGDDMDAEDIREFRERVDEILSKDYNIIINDEY
jgi:hypothetical protein